MQVIRGKARRARIDAATKNVEGESAWKNAAAPVKVVGGSSQFAEARAAS